MIFKSPVNPPICILWYITHPISCAIVGNFSLIPNGICEHAITIQGFVWTVSSSISSQAITRPFQLTEVFFFFSFFPSKNVQSLSGHATPIESVTFDSMEVLVVAGASSGVIKLWDLEETKSKLIYFFLFYKFTVT